MGLSTARRLSILSKASSTLPAQVAGLDQPLPRHGLRDLRPRPHLQVELLRGTGSAVVRAGQGQRLVFHRTPARYNRSGIRSVCKSSKKNIISLLCFIVYSTLNAISIY